MKALIIMLILALLVLGRIFYKIKEFDEVMNKMYEDEEERRNENKN